MKLKEAERERQRAGGEETNGGSVDGINKRDRDSDRGMRTGIKIILHYPQTHTHAHLRDGFCQPTMPRSPLLQCQSENENLCDSNWICTDEGHFIG